MRACARWVLRFTCMVAGEEGDGSRVTAAFVALAEALVTGFDVVDLHSDLIERCVELLKVASAGLVLADSRGTLQVMASTSDAAQQLQLAQIEDDHSPCARCFRTGGAVLISDLSAHREQWPTFADQAQQVGVQATYLIPMRLRKDTIGVLTLFDREADSISASTLSIAQGMADIATIALLQNRALRNTEALADQLQTALNSRIATEQAKGLLAERYTIDASEAFAWLRSQARRTNQNLTEVARAVMRGEVDPLPAAPSKAEEK